METIDLDKILLANNIDEILNTDSLKKIFINILKDKYKELSSIDIDELFNFDYSKKFASEKYQELDTLLELIKLENVDKLPKYKVTFKPTGTATLSLLSTTTKCPLPKTTAACTATCGCCARPAEKPSATCLRLSGSITVIWKRATTLPN